MTKSAGTLCLVLSAMVMSRAASGAQIEIDPSSGSGRTGESIRIKAGGLPASSTLAVFVGGVETFPQIITSDGTGAINNAIVFISGPLPAGRHDVVLREERDHTQKAGYTVRPTVTLDPPIGDGRAGETWRTNTAIPPGGYTGMIFQLKGSGFPADTFIPADSISLGEKATVHDPIRVATDGILPSTTVIVTSDLPSGRYTLSINAGSLKAAFGSVFHVTPWAATEAMRQRAGSRSIEAARAAIRRLSTYGGDILPPEDIAELEGDVDKAVVELKTGNFDSAVDIARQIQEKIPYLMRSTDDLRKDKLKGLVEVIASGFDTIQPIGAPPSRQAAQTVDAGRAKLQEAMAAIDKGEFETAKNMLKAGNDLLKQARTETGVNAPQEQIRW